MRSWAKQNGAAKDLCRRLTNVGVKWNYVFFPSFEAYLSKLGLQKSLRAAASAAETAICGGGLIWKRANSPPRIIVRRVGGVTKKMRRNLLIEAAGVVFLVPSIGTPPRPREKRMLRDIFLIARPPLLAVMRGGEFAI